MNNQDILLKAASLCRQAADELRSANPPEKVAGDVVRGLVAKGLIPTSESARFTHQLLDKPEKLASIQESLSALPSRIGAIGEVADNTQKGGLDAFDRFLMS